jgi:hypothetical protein
MRSVTTRTLQMVQVGQDHVAVEVFDREHARLLTGAF